MVEDLDQLTEYEIAQRLKKAYEADPSTDDPEYPDFVRIAYGSSGPPRQAAILVPLLRKADEWHLLFTRRKVGLNEHSGQVAYPGGRADPSDDSYEITALREANEELGIEPGYVRILGRMKSFMTITNYLVTPIIGVLPWPYPLQLADNEVSRAFTIPLNWLANPSNYEEQERQLPDPFNPVSVIYFKPYSGEVLWGASARITLAFIEILNNLLLKR